MAWQDCFVVYVHLSSPHRGTNFSIFLPADLTVPASNGRFHLFSLSPALFSSNAQRFAFLVLFTFPGSFSPKIFGKEAKTQKGGKNRSSMGKHHTSSSMQSGCLSGNQTTSSNTNPNYKWVRMFNVLDHHRWTHVKKKLTTSKKHGEDKQFTGSEENPGHAYPPVAPPPVVPEAVNVPNDEKPKGSSSIIKGRAGKLKAMITKEVLWKKGKHRRNSTCPGNTEGAGDHHDQHPSDRKQEQPPVNDDANLAPNPAIIRESNGNFYPKEYEYIFAGISQDTQLNDADRPAGHTLSADGEEQLADGDKTNLAQGNEDDEALLFLKNMDMGPSSKASLNRSATFHQSKELLDAMDLLSLNKDFFLKVLEDPESSLSQHFMAQQASGMRHQRLEKSGTFPRSSSSSPSKKGALLGKRKLSFKEPDQSLNTPTLNKPLNSQQGSEVQFRDLRQKIKHVIRESKKERLRVAMDAVLHKVPYGPQYFQNGRDVTNQLKSDMEKEDVKSSSNLSSSSFKRDDKWKVARSSSFHGSMERYHKLFEISYQKDSKDPTSDKLKMKRDEEHQTPTRKCRSVLARISSSPNLGRFYHRDSNASSKHHHVPDFLAVTQLAKGGSKKFSQQKAKALPQPSLEQSVNEETLLSEVEGGAEPNHDQGVTKVGSDDDKTSLRVLDGDYYSKSKAAEVVISQDNDATNSTGVPTERLETSPPAYALDHHMEEDSTSHEESLGGRDFLDQQDGTSLDKRESKKVGEDSLNETAGIHMDSVDSKKDEEDSSSQQDSNLDKEAHNVYVDETNSASLQQQSMIDSNLVESDKTESKQHDGDTFNWLDFDPKWEADFSHAQLTSSTLDYCVEVAGMDEEDFANQRHGTNLELVESAEKAEKDGGSILEHDSHRQVQVDSKDQADFNYVKDILHISGYSGSQGLGTWSSSNVPVDPSLFTEMESWTTLQEPYHFMKHDLEESTERRCNRLLLFELVNEVLLETYERSMTYWSSPLTACSWIHPMPKGHHVLEEVWANISRYLGSRQDPEFSLDLLSTKDLAKDDGWMNLQQEAEYVALELEGLIFEDLLEEFGS